MSSQMPKPLTPKSTKSILSLTERVSRQLASDLWQLERTQASSKEIQDNLANTIENLTMAIGSLQSAIEELIESLKKKIGQG